MDQTTVIAPGPIREELKAERIQAGFPGMGAAIEPGLSREELEAERIHEALAGLPGWELTAEGKAINPHLRGDGVAQPPAGGLCRLRRRAGPAPRRSGGAGRAGGRGHRDPRQPHRRRPHRGRARPGAGARAVEEGQTL